MPPTWPDSGRSCKPIPPSRFFQPSPQKAPWHVQAVIDLGGDVQLINFWPHKMKGQRDGYKPVEGEHAIRGIIEQALVDAGHDHDFDFFED